MTLEEMWNSGTEWATDNVIEPVTDWVEDKVIDYKINQIKDDYVDSFKDAFVSHDKLTPELIKQGWKLGLDNVPYNSNLKYTADDWARDQANAAADARVQAAATGGSTGGSTGTTGSGSFLSQDLRQRTPSGTMYNPDISEYLNSGLFNYTGPGGVPEYTYGQGLRTDGADYGIWGTPTDVPNPYYWGQFGEGYTEPTGPADGAISLPPVDLPAGVPPTNNNPNVGTNTTNINVGGNNTGGGTGPDGKDLTYQETLDYFGLDPVSTTFPGPETVVDTPDSVLPVGIPDLLSDYWQGVTDWGSELVGGLLDDSDYSNLTNVQDTAPANSGLQWVDTGNNYDTGDAMADSILGGEAYAQLVYNNDPVAESIQGLLGDSNDFNLGRPTDSNYVPFEPTYTKPVIAPFAGPPNAPAVEPEKPIYGYQMGDDIGTNVWSSYKPHLETNSYWR